MITLEQISQQIALAIRQSTLTQTEIAKQLGVKQPTVSDYVHGKALPALDTLANLCKILDLDANELLCLSGI